MEAIILAGPNGSGKTTIAKELILNNPSLVYLSADLMAEQINPQNVSSVKISAGRAFYREMNAHMGSGKNLLMNGGYITILMSSMKKLLPAYAKITPF